MNNKFLIKVNHYSVKDLFSVLSKDKEKQSLASKVQMKLEEMSKCGRIPGFCRKLQDNLWELKVQKVRIIYSIDNSVINLLYGFIKSTPQLPKNYLKIAQRQQMLLAA